MNQGELSLSAMRNINYPHEIFITRLMVAFTAIAAVMAFVRVAEIGLQLAAAGDWTGVGVQFVFALVIVALIYGFFVYLISRLGYLQRRQVHVPASREDLDTVYGTKADA